MVSRLSPYMVNETRSVWQTPRSAERWEFRCLALSFYIATSSVKNGFDCTEARNVDNMDVGKHNSSEDWCNRCSQQEEIWCEAKKIHWAKIFTCGEKSQQDSARFLCPKLRANKVDRTTVWVFTVKKFIRKHISAHLFSPTSVTRLPFSYSLGCQFGVSSCLAQRVFLRILPFSGFRSSISLLLLRITTTSSDIDRQFFFLKMSLNLLTVD